MRRLGCEALLVGVFAGLATIGLAGTAFLLAHRTVPDWLLPAAAIAAVAVACTQRRTAPTNASTRAWQTWLLVGGALCGATVIAWGSLATASRHWDGAAMWDVKTAALLAEPTLQQPFFREPAVYCHSRDYPLLQPLTIALCERWSLPGRGLFVVAWLAFVAAVVAAARAAGQGGGHLCAFAFAAMLTPILLAPTSGGFDSGYGDGLLAAAMATIAFGVTTRAALPIALGCIVAVLQKPEGLPYCLALTGLCWLLRERRLWLVAGSATAIAASFGLALGGDLRTFGAASHAFVLAGAAGATIGVLWLLDRAMQSRPHQVALRASLLLLAAIAVAVIACNLDGELGPRLAGRLHDIPRVLAAAFGWAFGDRFGLAFVLPLLLVVARWRTSGHPIDRSLGCWLSSAVAIACLPFLALPLDDVEHHLRSTMPRLWLHWTGVAWVFTVAHWPDASAGSPSTITAASAGT